MPAPTWKRLGYVTEDVFSEELRRLYEDEQLSHHMIAERWGAHTETVRLLCKRYKIRARSRNDALCLSWQRDKFDVELSDREKVVFDGLLLGDGHFEVSEGGCSVRYSHGSKYVETLEMLQKELPSLSFGPVWTQPSTGYFFVKSRAYAQLLEWRKRWYLNGKQRVPRDIKLHPLTLYWFFVGDGSICRGRYDLKLSTDGFADSCISLLREKLSELGIHTRRPPSRPVIMVSAASVPRFYKIIGPCRSPEYAYKWDYKKPRWTFIRKELRGCAVRS